MLGFILQIKLGTLAERGNKLLGDNVTFNLTAALLGELESCSKWKNGGTEEVTLWIQGWLWSSEGKLKSSLVTKGFHFTRGSCSHSHAMPAAPGKLSLHSVNYLVGNGACHLQPLPGHISER